jgi:hypothetical protein
MQENSFWDALSVATVVKHVAGKAPNYLALLL